MSAGIRLITVILFCNCLCFGINAQDRQQKNDSVFNLVKRYLDRQQADSMYALTGQQFRTNISQERFRGISKQLFSLGRVKESSFMSFKKGISNYKLELANASIQVTLGLDSADKIQAFLFKPYSPDVARKAGNVASSNKLQNLFEQRLDSIARDYIQGGNTVGLSIGLMRNGVMTFYGYGSTEKDGQQLPDHASIFEIGSISKTFTSLLLAYYAAEHKLELSDPITKYLPDSVAANDTLKSITLQMLSNHTSGLPRMPSNFLMVSRDPLNPYKVYGRDALFANLRKVTLATAPGKEFAYSNLGAALLGVILEGVSGKTYEQMVADVIARPLKMNNTMQHMSPAQSSRMVKVYDDKGSETPAWEFEAFAPAGALRSNARDLLLYVKAQMTQEKTSLCRATKLMQQPTYESSLSMGLGWFMRKEAAGTIYYHGGATYGSNAFVAFMPEKKVAIVLLSNAAADVEATAMRIFNLFIEE